MRDYRFCPRCGTAREGDYAFCGRCGLTFVEATSPTGPEPRAVDAPAGSLEGAVVESSTPAAEIRSDSGLVASPAHAAAPLQPTHVVVPSDEPLLFHVARLEAAASIVTRCYEGKLPLSDIELLQLSEELADAGQLALDSRAGFDDSTPDRASALPERVAWVYAEVGRATEGMLARDWASAEASIPTARLAIKDLRRVAGPRTMVVPGWVETNQVTPSQVEPAQEEPAQEEPIPRDLTRYWWIAAGIVAVVAVAAVAAPVIAPASQGAPVSVNNLATSVAINLAIYLGIFAAIYGLARVTRRGPRTPAAVLVLGVGGPVLIGIALGLLAVYLPDGGPFGAGSGAVVTERGTGYQLVEVTLPATGDY